MKDNQPSITAENTAAVRAFEAMRPRHQQVCNDSYAYHFLSDRFTSSSNVPDAISQTLDNWEKTVPGVCGSIIARTRFIDDCLAKAIQNRIEQLVILGAGFDTRALRFAALKQKVNVFEVDHLCTQQHKLERLKCCWPDLGHYVTYIPINFEKNNFGEALLAHGYDRAMRTFYIWEGVSYYLSAKVVDDTLAFVAQNSSLGSEIVFDYFPTSVMQGTCRLPEARPLTHILKQFGEGIHFGISPEKITDFMNKRGFEIVRNLASTDYKQAYFKGKACKDRSVSNLFYFAHAMVTRLKTHSQT